jgi:hypothetical protein
MMNSATQSSTTTTQPPNGPSSSEAKTTAANSISNNNSHSNTTKKRFGKNLNKLTAPPPAAVAHGGSGGGTGTKTNASSKNGLLLLSTKRQSSKHNGVASLATGGAGGGGGGVGSGCGGILSSKTAQSTPKHIPNLGLHIESNTSTHDALLGAVVGASRLESQQQLDAWGVAEKQLNVESVNLASPEPEEKVSKNSDERSPAVEGKGSMDHHGDSHDTDDTMHPEFRTSNWDEYGGRNLPGEKDGNAATENSHDEQGAYMAKLAKERAEKKRGEEEHRIVEQKERAAQRLRQLDEKMASKQETAKPSEESRKKVSSPALSSREQVTPRKLYDPNAPGKSYGSLSPKQDSAAKPTVESNVSNQSFDRQQAVIHLASYDDQDRGERGAGTAPRMLFDPKSGSMVEVPSRDDSTNTRNRKERGKKGKNTRDKDVKDVNVESKNGRKGKNSRKEEGTILQRGKGGGDSSSTAKSETKKGKIVDSRKFPRTNGVLYSRDRKGILYCVDGCDGDLGYGVHSVPGGRIKNSCAYSKFADNHKQVKNFDSRQDTSFDPKDTQRHQESNYSQLSGFPFPEVKEPKLDWIKPNEKIELITGVDESPTLQATAREWAPSHTTYVIPGREETAITSADSIDHDQEDDEDAPVSMLYGYFFVLNHDLIICSLL